MLIYGFMLMALFSIVMSDPMEDFRKEARNLLKTPQSPLLGSDECLAKQKELIAEFKDVFSGKDRKNLAISDILSRAKKSMCVLDETCFRTILSSLQPLLMLYGSDFFPMNNGLSGKDLYETLCSLNEESGKEDL